MRKLVEGLRSRYLMHLRYFLAYVLQNKQADRLDVLGQSSRKYVCRHVTFTPHREHVTTRKLQTTEEGLKYLVESY